MRKWLGCARGFYRRKEGQSLVEFALVLPMLLLIVMAIIDMGRVFHATIVVQEAARDAVRYASVGENDQRIAQAIKDDTPTLQADQVSFTITPSASSRIPGTAVTLEIRYNIELITPLMAQFLPNPFPVKSDVTMRME